MAVKMERFECDCCKLEFKRVYYRYKGRKKYQFCEECVESMYWTDRCLGLSDEEATPGLADFERDSKKSPQLVGV